MEGLGAQGASSGSGGEDGSSHLGILVSGVTDVGPAGITEAWDEPLSRDEVLAIAGPFIRG